MSRSPSPSRRNLASTPRPDDTVVNHKKPFLVRHKEENLLENRDFSSFVRPKPRRSRSKSPTRRPRSTSPSRLGMSSVQPLPGLCQGVYSVYPEGMGVREYSMDPWGVGVRVYSMDPLSRFVTLPKLLVMIT